MVTEIKINPGTAVTWTSSGGTYALTLTSLAASAGRIGPVHDLGDPFPRRVAVSLRMKFATSPTAFGSVGVWLMTSPNNSNFDGGQSAGDAALSDLAIISQMFPVGTLVADDSTNTQQATWIVRVPARYIVPVVYNYADQAFGSTGTDHVLTVVPMVDEIQ